MKRTNRVVIHELFLCTVKSYMRHSYADDFPVFLVALDAIVNELYK